MGDDAEKRILRDRKKIAEGGEASVYKLRTGRPLDADEPDALKAGETFEKLLAHGRKPGIPTPGFR